mgnify:CR=1 FL=1
MAIRLVVMMGVRCYGACIFVVVGVRGIQRGSEKDWECPKAEGQTNQERDESPTPRNPLRVGNRLIGGRAT